MLAKSTDLDGRVSGNSITVLIVRSWLTYDGSVQEVLEPVTLDTYFRSIWLHWSLMENSLDEACDQHVTSLITLHIFIPTILPIYSYLNSGFGSLVGNGGQESWPLILHLLKWDLCSFCYTSLYICWRVSCKSLPSCFSMRPGEGLKLPSNVFGLWIWPGDDPCRDGYICLVDSVRWLNLVWYVCLEVGVASVYHLQT